MNEVELRVHGPADRPALLYLPGLHGDWTLATGFRLALAGRFRWVEVSYPRTTCWSLEDHVAAIQGALSNAGICHGWLVGESFGSQIAWALLAETEEHRAWRVEGLILVGGFVRYPLMWGVHCVERCHRSMPMEIVRRLCQLYGAYAGVRYARTAEVRASITEFLRRRSEEADRQAILHRYRLIARSDYRSLARRTCLPVYYLTGLLDPVVPWGLVWPWIKRNCSGYRAGRLIAHSDHNVLSTAPRAAAETICHWVGGR